MSQDRIYENYDEIILGGKLASQGMPNFKNKLTKNDVDKIKAYILFTAKSLRENPMQYRETLTNYQEIADQVKRLK